MLSLQEILNLLYNFVFYCYIRINTYRKELFNNYPNIHLFLRNTLLSLQTSIFCMNYYNILSTDILFADQKTENLLFDEVNKIIDCMKMNKRQCNYEINKNKYSLLEGLIIELCKNDMKRRNMTLDLNTQAIEYWTNTNYYNIHFDCDEELYNTQYILKQAIHNGILYMTDSDEPTFISEYTLEDLNLNRTNNIDSSFFLHFPKKLNNLSFNGKCFHGAVKMYDQKDKDRIIVAYNVWEKENKPSMNESILTAIDMDDHELALIENNNIIEHSIYARPDYNEIINQENAESIKLYIKYVLEQKRRKLLKENYNLHIFSTPSSRVQLYDIIGPICSEVKNITTSNNNSHKDTILWQRIRQKNVFDTSLCNTLINEAETYAGSSNWPLIHDAYKSNSIKVENLKSFNNVLTIFGKNIMPLLHDIYKSELTFNVLDMFINKYDTVHNASGLSRHQDEGHITINILLNNESDFEGGGTRFIENEEIINLNQGEALFHCAKDFHEGVKISKGVRYIMVIFLEIDIPF